MRVWETKRPRDRRTVEAQLLSFQEARVQKSFWERFWLHSACVLIKPLRYPDVLLLSVCARIIWNTQEGKHNHPSSVESGDKTWEGCWIPKKWIFLVVVQWKFQNSTAFRLWQMTTRSLTQIYGESKERDVEILNRPRKGVWGCGQRPCSKSSYGI